MNISDYKYRTLKRKNKVFNVFLLLFLNLFILVFIIICVSDRSFDYFDSKSDEITDEISDLILDEAKQYYSSMDISYEMDEENICVNIEYLEFEDESVQQMVEDKCAEGPLTSDQLADVMANYQFSMLEDNIRTGVKEGFDNSTADAKAKIDSLRGSYFFLNEAWLPFLIALLLTLYLFNNDLVIFINYLSKELIIIVIFAFLMPYFLFKYDLIGWLLAKMDLVSILNIDAAIDPRRIISEVFRIINEHFLHFYEQYLIYSLFALGLGILMWIGNKYLVMPHFISRMDGHRLKVPEKKEEKKKEPEKKEVQKKLAEAKPKSEKKEI